ncbi:MAG: hypothetical protein ACT4P2_09195 [Pseudomonadota bacterium]
MLVTPSSALLHALSRLAPQLPAAAPVHADALGAQAAARGEGTNARPALPAAPTTRPEPGPARQRGRLIDISV